MVLKKFSLIILGILLIGMVSAWNVDITKLNDESIISNYGEKISNFSYELSGNINDSDISSICWTYNTSLGINKTCDPSTKNLIDTLDVSSIENDNLIALNVTLNNNESKKANITFWVDSIAPNLTYMQPWGPLYFTNQNSFNFQFRLDETNKGDYDNGPLFKPFKLKLYDPYNNTDSPFPLENITYELSEIHSVDSLDYEGAYTWIAKSEDIDPNGNTIREVNITGTIIRDVTNPNINIITPANNSNVSGFVWVNISASDTYGPKNITINVSNSTDNYLIDSCSYNTTCNYYWNSSTVSDGQYTITATAYDKAGNTNSTNIIINIDNHAPIVNIVYPIGTSYSSINELNYTITEINPDSCWYSNDSGSNNYSIQIAGENFTGLNANEGINNWTVYCNDASGNIGSDSVEFIVDNTAPEVSIINPLNKTYNTTSINFNISVNDDSSINSCSLELNENKNYSMSQNGNYWNLTNSSIAQGSHTAKFYCYDSLVNLNDSEEVSFFIDSVNPIVDIISPSNTSKHNVTNVPINYTYDELNPDTCWYTDNFETNTTITCGENITNEIWKEGWNTVIIWMGDIAGNVNSSSVTFFIDSIAPEIEILSPENNSYLNDTELNIIYNLSEETGSCWYSNDSMSINTTLPNCANITDVNWTEGQHNVTIWANDSLNNTNSKSITFTIDITAPKIPLSNITQSDKTHNSITITWDTDENANSIVYYGKIIETLSNKSNSTQILNHEIILNGLSASTTYFYNVSSCDLAGNCNVSSQYNFTTNNAPSTPSSSGGGGGGSSCKTIWNCAKWDKWSICEDGIQFRDCLIYTRTLCGEGFDKNILEAGQNQSCSLTIAQPQSEEPQEEQSSGEESGGFISRITGGVVGFAKTGAGILTLLIVLGLSTLGIVTHFKRKSLKRHSYHFHHHPK